MRQTVYLIRHGQTECNREGLYYGRLDVPLNSVGEVQMAQLRERMKGTPFDVVAASTMLRARQSAAILFPQTPILFDQDFQEIDFGKWEGLFYEEIMRLYASDYQAWLDDPYQNAPTGGESMGAMHARIIPAFERLLVNHPGPTLALVSHAGTVRIIVRYLLGANSPQFWDIPIDNSHYWRFELENRTVMEQAYE